MAERNRRGPEYSMPTSYSAESAACPQPRRRDLHLPRPRWQAGLRIRRRGQPDAVAPARHRAPRHL